MGNTLINMDTDILHKDTNLRIWERGQMVLTLSFTKEAKNSIYGSNIINKLNS